MTGLGNYLEGAICSWINGAAFPTAPTTVYVALYTVAPTGASGSGTEVSGGSYARVAVPAFNWTQSGSGPYQLANTNTITFPTATASWGTVVAAAIYDAATAGDELAWGGLSSLTAIGNGVTFTFASGALVLGPTLVAGTGLGINSTAYTWAIKTANYAIQPTDNSIAMNAASGPLTASVPTAIGSTQRVTIKKWDTTANAVTLTPVVTGQLIDGQASFVLANAYDSITLIADGTANWGIE